VKKNKLTYSSYLKQQGKKIIVVATNNVRLVDLQLMHWKMKVDMKMMKEIFVDLSIEDRILVLQKMNLMRSCLKEQDK
jgi:hypothetical protein